MRIDGLLERARGLLTPARTRRLGLFSLAFAVTFVVFFTFPVLNYLQHREKKKRPESGGARAITLQPVNLNEEKKEKRKLKMRDAKPQKAAAKAETGRFQLKLGVAAEGGVSVSDSDTKVIVYNEGEVDQEAVPTKRNLPRKPQAAEAAGVAGEVEVEFVVDESGKVISAKAVKVNPDGYGFKEAAVNAIWEWRFKPATYKKIPVRVRYLVPIRFQ
ncbi:MAG: TonB family protein [Spirochaetes bacterium]|nr:TonB family protein [Spirochaetota bacterium]